ncbi:MAG: FkbM family methyltransferase [Polyangiales bacterium]
MSVLDAVKRTVQRTLSRAGYQLVRHENPSQRATQRGVLLRAKQLGLAPATVIDVGVADGTPALYETFPDARLLLLEPLVEYRDALERIVRAHPGASYELAAASASRGSVTLNVHPDLFGSSLYLEREDSDVNGVPRTVPTVTVDDACAARGLKGPYLIKVDVQGAELDVLRGATRTLRETALVLLEVSLLEFFEGGPVMADVLAFMAEQEFCAYDLCDLSYRPLDGAMSQLDVAFVRKTGALRRHHTYATPAQRRAHNEAARVARPHAS